MNVFGAVPTGFTNDDVVALFVPFENRSGPDSQTLPDFRRYRNLTLGRQLRMRERHATYITTVMRRSVAQLEALFQHPRFRREEQRDHLLVVVAIDDDHE